MLGRARAEPFYKGENIGILDPSIGYHDSMGKIINKTVIKCEFFVKHEIRPAFHKKRRAC